MLPEEVLVQLTDDDNIGVVDSAMVAEAIDTAGAEIDGWCAAQYVVPFVQVPALIKKCAIDVAIYNLYSRRVETIPETRATRYKEAMRLLKDIATGAVPLDTALVATTERPTDAMFISEERLMRRSTLTGR